MATSKTGLSYKLRTASMRTEYNGSHREGLRLLFVGLPTPEARESMLSELAETHEKMLERERLNGEVGASHEAIP